MKKIISNIIIISSIFITISCQNTKIKFNDLPLLSTPESIKSKLSTINSDTSLYSFCKRIHLESNDSSLLGTIKKVIFSDGLYYILDNSITNKVEIFDTTGKFIKKVGNQGEKKEEYIYPTDMIITAKNIIIYDNPGFKLIYYTKNGIFEKIVHIEDRWFKKRGYVSNIWYLEKNQNLYFNILKLMPYKGIENDDRIFSINANFKQAYSFGKYEVENDTAAFENYNKTAIDSLGNFWVGNYFLSTIDIFNCQGKIIKTIDVSNGADNYLNRYKPKDNKGSEKDLLSWIDSKCGIRDVLNIQNKFMLVIVMCPDSIDLSFSKIYNMNGEIINNKIKMEPIGGECFAHAYVGIKNDMIIVPVDHNHYSEDQQKSNDKHDNELISNPDLVFFNIQM